MALYTMLKLLLMQRREPQYEFAARVGLSESRLSRIIHGRVAATDAELSRIAKELGVDKAALLAAVPSNDTLETNS